MSPFRRVLLFGGRRRGGGEPAYLLNSQWTTPAVAPLSASLPAEPGPGTVAITDAIGALSISGGALVTDLLITDDGAQTITSTIRELDIARSRAAGLASVHSVELQNSGDASRFAPLVGFFADSNPGYNDFESGVYFRQASSELYWKSAAVYSLFPLPIADDTKYVVTVILRATGSYVLVNGHLYWIDATSAGASVYSGAIADNGNFSCAKHQVCDLSAWLDPALDLADSSETSPSVGTTQRCPKNAMVELFVNPLPSAGTVQYDVRYVDGSNYVSIEIAANGSIEVNDVVAGVSTTRLSGGAATVTDGDRVCLRINEAAAELHVETTPIGSTSGIVHQTVGVGRCTDLGTGGVIAKSTCTPIDLRSKLPGVCYS